VEIVILLIFPFDALIFLISIFIKSDPTAALARINGTVPGCFTSNWSAIKFTKSLNGAGGESEAM